MSIFRKSVANWKEKYTKLQNDCCLAKKSLEAYKASVKDAFNLQLNQPENTYDFERRLVVREIIESISAGRPLDWRLCEICNGWFPKMDIHCLAKPILNKKSEEIGGYSIRHCKRRKCRDKAENLLRDYQKEEN